MVSDEIEEYKKRNPGVNVDGFSNFFKGMIDKKFQDTEEFKLTSKWNSVILDAKPITNVIEELLLLSQHASENGYCLRVPLHHLSPNLINIPTTQNFDSVATQIFRITTQQLGAIPAFNTLKNALDLAEQPETLALREKISVWIESLNNSSVDTTNKIQREIKEASNSLAKASKLKSAGLITGIISIPVSAVGIINPFLGALGLGLTCIGVTLDRSGNSLEKSVIWVGFGGYNS